MQRRIGHAHIESIAAESPKFTAPMLLIHGLWCTAAVWRQCMGYFAHRGWTCHAITLRGHGATPPAAVADVSFADYLADVRAAVAACESMPIVVGHDLGGLLALCCDPSTIRAVVTLAPLVPRSCAATPNPALSRFGVRLATLRARPLPPPRGKLAIEYFGGAVPGGVVPESNRVARELGHDDVPLFTHRGIPALVLAGGHDRFSRADDVAKLAKHAGAEFQAVADAHHAMPWNPGWEHLVSEIHRWLVRSLGDPLLAMRDEEDE